jgi:hypothetical protein
MSRRWKIFIAVGILLGVAILIPVIHHYQLRAATEAYIAQLKAQGEPMELAQVIPPPVPPDQNAASVITNALAQIDLESNYTNSIIFNNEPYAMNRIIPGKKLIGWRQPFIHDPDGYSYPTNTWDDLSAQLSDRQNDINDFRKLIKKPTLDFYYNYSDPKIYIPALAPHLSQVKLAIQWLEASEYYNLHEDKTANACADVRAMLAFVIAQTNERFLISQLSRLAFARIAADATWNVLQTTNVSDSSLAQLQQDWESPEFMLPLKNAFLFERVSELQLLDDLHRSPTNLDAQVAWTMFGMNYHYNYKQTENGTYVLDDERSFLGKVIDGISTRWDKSQWQWFWSYTDEMRGVRMWRAVTDGIQMLETNRSFRLVQSFVNTNFTQIGFDSVKDNPYAMISQYAHNQLSAMKRLTEVETARNIVIVAIGLKRYELRYHHLPDSLDQLIPEFLKSVPTDYMDGQPLRYRRNADGTFLLYSVGENGKDDGGNPGLEQGVESSSYYWQNPLALDWVWPQPATPEEIRNYYAHPPK